MPTQPFLHSDALNCSTELACKARREFPSPQCIPVEVGFVLRVTVAPPEPWHGPLHCQGPVHHWPLHCFQLRESSFHCH